MPPLGASPAAVAPPILAPSRSSSAADSTPNVDSYDVEEYPVQPGDTLKSVAQARYGAPGYEGALLLYNRKDPRASEGLQQDPPVLRPGDSLYIPAREYLDKHYGTGAAPAPAPGGFGAGSAGYSIPSTSNRIPPPAATSVAASDRMYTVKDPRGELFMAIAGQELKNINRFNDIAQLNKGFPLQEPVPAGTRLRMPADWSPSTAATP